MRPYAAAVRPRPARVLRAIGVLGAVLALTALLTAGQPGFAAAPPGTPWAAPTAASKTVGPLFRNGTSNPHECSASVIASTTRDLILTAAHCIVGNPTGWKFAPGYVNGRTPYGVWTVRGAYLPPGWVHRADPHRDYAILRVEPQVHGGRLVHVQDVTGGNPIVSAPPAGKKVTTVAYNAGLNDQPVACSTTSYRARDYPAFNCHGYVGGSSGGPWLIATGPHTVGVAGVIGGLHQGGCTEFTSYTAPFGDGIQHLLLRAQTGSDTDAAPAPPPDGC